MPAFNTQEVIELTNIGGTINLPVTDTFTQYTIDGTEIVLSGNLTISTTDIPSNGVSFNILWNGNGLNLNGHTISIFGLSLTTAQAAGKFTIDANYQGDSLVTQIKPSLDQTGIIDGSLITEGTITNSLLNASLNTNINTIQVSFESNEQSDNTISIPYNYTITSIFYICTKALAGTDNGIITISTEENGTLATLTLSQSLAINSSGTLALTVPSQPANTQISFSTSKTTPGGKVLLSLTIVRLP